MNGHVEYGPILFLKKQKKTLLKHKCINVNVASNIISLWYRHLGRTMSSLCSVCEVPGLHRLKLHSEFQVFKWTLDSRKQEAQKDTENRICLQLLIKADTDGL